MNPLPRPRLFTVNLCYCLYAAAADDNDDHHNTYAYIHVNKIINIESDRR